MKQWIPLKIVLLVGLFMLVQYFIPRDESEFVYEYALDFTIIIGIFALALGIWSMVRVSYEKIKRRTPGWGYSWVALIGLAMMLFFGFFWVKVGNVGDQPAAVAFADVDLDRDLDVVVANRATDNISVFKNGGRYAFLSAYTFPAGPVPCALAAADLDADGDNDLVVANDTAGTITLLTNASQAGDFSKKRLRITPQVTVDSIFNVGPPRFSAPVSLKVGSEPRAVAVGDLNGDGVPNDLAVASSGTGNVSVLLNDGTGKFGTAQSFPAGTAPAAVCIADIDRDLTNDLLVANARSKDITILRGLGAGRFEKSGYINLPEGTPVGLVAGDFDGNGFLDLAVCTNDDKQAGAVVLLKSDSTVRFGPRVSFASGKGPVGMIAADLDSDNVRELLVTCQGDNTVRVHKYDGAGFPLAQTLTAGRQPMAVAAGALDRAAKPDLAIANLQANSVSILVNKGGLNFDVGSQLRSGDILFLGGDRTNYFYRAFFNSVVIPIQSTMFALLAFYIASAAYRAFRARSLLATILLAAALIIMIRFIPLGPVTDLMSGLASWILKIPNMAAKRAIFIGIGLGAVATAVKVVLGIERTYMGKD